MRVPRWKRLPVCEKKKKNASTKGVTSGGKVVRGSCYLERMTEMEERRKQKLEIRRERREVRSKNLFLILQIKEQDKYT